jgi:hypothetical protein
MGQKELSLKNTLAGSPYGDRQPASTKTIYSLPRYTGLRSSGAMGGTEVIVEVVGMWARNEVPCPLSFSPFPDGKGAGG